MRNPSHHFWPFEMIFQWQNHSPHQRICCLELAWHCSIFTCSLMSLQTQTNCWQTCCNNCATGSQQILSRQHEVSASYFPSHQKLGSENKKGKRKKLNIIFEGFNLSHSQKAHDWCLSSSPSIKLDWFLLSKKSSGLLKVWSEIFTFSVIFQAGNKYGCTCVTTGKELNILSWKVSLDHETISIIHSSRIVDNQGCEKCP